MVELLRGSIRSEMNMILTLNLWNTTKSKSEMKNSQPKEENTTNKNGASQSDESQSTPKAYGNALK